MFSLLMAGQRASMNLWTKWRTPGHDTRLEPMCASCFLSNPQNLDISHLIQSPRESPFARALEHASEMLVVPNHVCSLAKWWVYEAFLGYLWNKRIQMARAPVTFGPSVLRVSSTGFIVLGFTLLLQMSLTTYLGYSRSYWDWGFFRIAALVSFVAMVSSGVAVGLHFLFRKTEHVTCQLAVFAFATFSHGYVAPEIARDGLTHSSSITELILAFLGLAAVEADRLGAIQSLQQSRQLRKNFTKSVRNAMSSNPEDLRNIFREMEQHGQIEAVDRTVELFLAMNISTKQLHYVTDRAGLLGTMSGWSRFLFISVLGMCGSCCVTVRKYRINLWEPEVPFFHWLLWIVIIMEIVLWLLIFLPLRVERKAFAEKCVSLWILFAAPMWVGLWQGMGGEVLVAFWIMPAILLMTALGPARIAALPFFGPILLRFLFGRNWGIVKQDDAERNASPEVANTQEASPEDNEDPLESHYL
ncbi:Uncharacterized protein SCF082_LOCUS43436 [Durusdinium trenchii]|uniref:Uncharacterized protein n=1 Tax=Durusdinium trenchii TaxID=1381693 RepID=A0ABP0QVI4_9DINO